MAAMGRTPLRFNRRWPDAVMTKRIVLALEHYPCRHIILQIAAQLEQLKIFHIITVVE